MARSGRTGRDAAAVLALLLGGCGGGSGDAPPRLVGGSRLEPTWFETPGGQQVAVAPDGWHDRKLDIPCTSTIASDGTGRCFPRSQAYGTIRFRDAACTQRAIFDGQQPPNACASLYNPLATGWASTQDGWAPITGPLASAKVYQLDAAGRCIAEGAAGGYAIGAPVPDATFVGFAAAAPVGSGRLRALVRVADDGARETTGLWDDTRGGPCTPGDPGDGVTRCLPPASNVDFYLDAACSQPVAWSSDGAAPPATAVVTSGPVQQYFAIGAQVTPRALYVTMNGQCVLTPFQPPSGTYWMLGAAIPLASFATLHDVALTSGRIVQHGWADEHGAVLDRFASLHDTMLDADVAPLYRDDVTVVLAPADWTHIDYYADAACTQPLVAGATAPHLAVTDDSGPQGCDVRHAFAVGAEVQPSQVYQLSGTSCSPAPLPAASLFAVGAELPASTFVALSIGH